MTQGGEPLVRFNGLAPEEAERELIACCASAGWAREVAAGRPYGSREALLRAAEAAMERLAWSDIAEGLAGHPRIGERAPGSDRSARWSRREQASVGGPSDALVDLNKAYEERFGHVFLIFASGRSEAEILAAGRARLGNDEETERAVVRGELARIAALRLERLVRP